MSEQANVQRIGAYVWSLVLTVAGGALIIGALAGPRGEVPATVIANGVTPPSTAAADIVGATSGRGDGAEYTPVSNTE